jgi:hypothetical protein
MAELAGESAEAGENLAVGQDRSPNSFDNRHEYGVAHTIHAPEPQFRQERSTGCVVQLDGQTQAALDLGLDVEVMPSQVWREDQAMGHRVYPPGKADAYAFKGVAGMASAHLLHALDDAADGPLRVCVEHNILAGEKTSVQVNDRDDCAMRAHVRDQHDELVVEREQCRAASPGPGDDAAFIDPPLVQELFRDQRDGAWLQAGEPGEVRAGNRLPRADEFEDDVPVDVARNLAGCESRVGEVNSRPGYRYHRHIS